MSSETSPHMANVFDTLPAPSAFVSALGQELLTHRDCHTGLAPSIYLFKDMARARDVLGVGASDLFHVDSGTPEPPEARGMLRLCAPLARNGWQIFAKSAESACFFGVFYESPTCPANPIPPDRRLPNMGADKGTVAIARPTATSRVCHYIGARSRTVAHWIA